MFISIDRDSSGVKRSLLWVRSGGIAITVLGVSLIALSIPLGRGDDVVLRAGFAMMIIGLFGIFLFSESWMPRSFALSIARGQDINNARVLTSHNLKGRGTYMPPGGRLLSDRVFVPVDDRALPLPAPADESVINTGELGPRMGMFFVPPGKGLVDEVESQTGHRFSDDGPQDAEGSLERLTKGANLMKRISVRDRSGVVVMEVRHGPMGDICSEAFARYESLHRAMGCTPCSAALTAITRIYGVPLTIDTVKVEGDIVRYELRRTL